VPVHVACSSNTDRAGFCAGALIVRPSLLGVGTSIRSRPTGRRLATLPGSTRSGQALFAATCGSKNGSLAIHRRIDTLGGLVCDNNGVMAVEREIRMTATPDLLLGGGIGGWITAVNELHKRRVLHGFHFFPNRVWNRQ
jgi:hypothetical protein